MYKNYKNKLKVNWWHALAGFLGLLVGMALEVKTNFMGSKINE